MGFFEELEYHMNRKKLVYAIAEATDKVEELKKDIISNDNISEFQEAYENMRYLEFELENFDLKYRAYKNNI